MRAIDSGTSSAALARVLSFRDLARRLGRRRTRVVASGLIAYGASGALLLIALAIAVLPMASTIDAVARSSEDVRATLVTTENAFGDFSESLLSARRSAERAASAARSSASAAKQLADGMAVSIFGAQPLIGLSAGFQKQSSDLDSLASELDRLALSLGTNEADVRAIKTEIASLSSRANAMSVSGSALLVPALFLLLLWLAVPAVAAVAVGIGLARYGAKRHHA